MRRSRLGHSLAPWCRGGAPVTTWQRNARPACGERRVGGGVPRGGSQGACAILYPGSIANGIYSLGRVIDAVGQAHRGDRGQIKGFLNRPHPMLHGDTPFDPARSGSAGAEAVVSTIPVGTGYEELRGRKLQRMARRG